VKLIVCVTPDRQIKRYGRFLANVRVNPIEQNCATQEASEYAFLSQHFTSYVFRDLSAHTDRHSDMARSTGVQD